MQIDTLLLAKWVIPIEPDHAVWPDTAVAIHEGRILDVLPAVQAQQQYQAGNTIDLTNHVVLPGLINAHTHASMNLLRGFADDLPLMTWLQEYIWPAEQQWISHDFVYDGTLLACAEMLRGGTTCFADMYFFAESTARAAEHAGIRATIGLITVDFPSAYAQDAQEYLRKGLALHDQFRGHPLINTMFAPHAPYSVSDAPLSHIATLAEELDIPIHIHLHETEHEIAESLQKFGVRPMQRLEQLGLLTPRLVSAHMTHLTDEEIANYAQVGAHVVHCPESNLKLASGFCPLQKLLDADVNVALGTDGAASNNDLDMFGEMRTAALLAKGVANDAVAGKAETILRMATINGARALGLDGQIGTIEKGKAADLIAVDLSQLETMPNYDPVSTLVYAANRQQVTDVWIAGRHLMKNRELTTLDIRELEKTAQTWQTRLRP
ncbi:MAG: TRZ/ATZ family hydrolase [Gammaproteobacteria bacterium]|nr:TRZ/ATZ family hydrolase [Gammaproteobacteria bacterium]